MRIIVVRDRCTDSHIITDGPLNDCEMIIMMKQRLLSSCFVIKMKIQSNQLPSFIQFIYLKAIKASLYGSKVDSINFVNCIIMCRIVENPTHNIRSFLSL